MSSLMICDLKRNTELDKRAMGALRGGFAFAPAANVKLNVNQQIFQVQEIGVSVLNNNGTIGAGFVGPNVNLDVMQKATNNAFIPKFV